MSKPTGHAGRRWAAGLAAAGGLLAIGLAVLLITGAGEPEDGAVVAGLPASAAAAPPSAPEPTSPPVELSDPVGPLPPEIDDPDAWVVHESTVRPDEQEREEDEAAVAGPHEVYEADRPVRIVIPAIDVDETVVETGLLSSGAMEVADFGLAGWYGLGPKPGEVGPAVIAAHVSSVAGPDVFYRLDELEEGDEIRVEDADGAEHVFTVTDSELQPKVELPTERIWSEDDEPVLRLITCGGEFDPAARSHLSNVIVYAEHASR